MLEINFLAGGKHLLPGIICSSKANILSSKQCFLYNSPVTTHCQIYDKTKFHMVKSIDNAFDHMELCFVLKTEESFQ